MQRLEVRRTIEANQDLRDIWLYVRSDSQRAADGLIRRLIGTFDELAATPGLGRARPDLSEGLRSFPRGRFNIFYRADAATLMVVRVLSSYRDVTDQSFPET